MRLSCSRNGGLKLLLLVSQLSGAIVNGDFERTLFITPQYNVRQNLLDLRWITAILLFLLLLNSFFYCLYHNICILQRQAAVKASIASSTYNGNLTIIKIPLAAVDSAQMDDDEITIGNMLYDVVKRQTLHDTAYIYALPDDEEQQLVAKINTYLNAGPAMSRCGNTAVHTEVQPIKFLPQVYLNRLPQVNFNININTVELKNAACICCSAAYPEIPSPPPKAA